MRVVEKIHRQNKKKDKKDKRYSKSSESSIDTSSDDDTVVPITCKYCKKYSKKQHPAKITPETCMWNKKAKKFRFSKVCKKMNLTYIEGSKFDGKEADWPKHQPKEEGKKKDD